MNDKRQFVSVRELAKIYPCFSEASLRFLIFHSNTNGLKKCIRRLGRKILINITEFEDWIDSHVTIEEIKL